MEVSRFTPLCRFTDVTCSLTGDGLGPVTRLPCYAFRCCVVAKNKSKKNKKSKAKREAERLQAEEEERKAEILRVKKEAEKIRKEAEDAKRLKEQQES